MGIFRWHERHRGEVQHRSEDLAKERLDYWRSSVHSAANAIERWKGVPHQDWNLRQLEKRRRSIERGEEQK